MTRAEMIEAAAREVLERRKKACEDNPAARWEGSDGRYARLASALATASHPCICGHAHRADSDGADGGCKDGDCTCRRWRCDHLLLPGNGTCVRCGQSKEAIQCQAFACTRIPEDGSEFCSRHKGIPPGPYRSVTP